MTTPLDRLNNEELNALFTLMNTFAHDLEENETGDYVFTKARQYCISAEIYKLYPGILYKLRAMRERPDEFDPQWEEMLLSDLQRVLEAESKEKVKVSNEN